MTNRAGADPAPLQDASWFWAEQQAPPPNTVSAGLPTPDVPANDYAVAAKGGQSDKETFLHLNMSTFPETGTVSTFSMTLKEDAPPAGNLNVSAAKIVAAPVADFWAGGASGHTYGERPTVLDGPIAEGQRGDDGTWTFDISPIVTAWLSGATQNNGMVLRPADGLGPNDNFEVVWLGTSITADGTVTDDSSSGSDVAAAPTSSSSDFSSPSGSGSSASTSDTVPATTNGGDLSSSQSASAPLSSSSAPLTSPTTAAPATAAPSQATAAAVKRTSASKSDKGLPWVTIPIVIFFAGLLVAIGLSLGPMGEPAAPRRGSVIRRLERPIGSS